MRSLYSIYIYVYIHVRKQKSFKTFHQIGTAIKPIVDSQSLCQYYEIHSLFTISAKYLKEKKTAHLHVNEHELISCGLGCFITNIKTRKLYKFNKQI